MTISKLNNNYVAFTFKPDEDLPYKSLELLYNENGKNHTYIIRGVYINDSKFGKQGLVVTSQCYVNLPNHLTNDIEQIRQDDSLVNQINEGQAGFKIYHYFSNKYNKNCFSINWVDVPKEEQVVFFDEQ